MFPLDNAIAVTCAKGGVLKTSIVANVAGLAAQGGWKVLCVDADPQGNLAHDLGYRGHSDDGGGFFTAVRNGSTPNVLRDVRSGIDAIAGGAELHKLVDWLHLGRSDPDRATTALRRSLAPLVDDYDLILIDTPPGDALLRRSLTGAARFSLVPTAPDLASMDGLTSIVEDLRTVRATSPDHELLAVVLTNVFAGAREIRRSARHQLSNLLAHTAPVMMSTIRSAPKVAIECRDRGHLVIEYEAEARGLRPSGRRRASYSQAAIGLAEDYQALADELLERFIERRAHRPISLKTA